MSESNLIKIVFLLLKVSEIVDKATGENYIVNTNQGKIQGFYNFKYNYVEYLGIPYATFNGRFAEPGDSPSFNTTFKANNWFVVCKQYFPLTGTIIGQEDCLTLNIYKPVNPVSEPLAVIVFIYGGGYYWGTTSDLLYNPKYFIRKNVIIVKINYRVGAFGFLCLRNKGAPGNVGLKDQLAALKWIKDNIAAFGGDPNRVTAFGESAGATSINYFILTQRADGLFQRAIIDSGPVAMPHVFDRNPIQTAETVARGMGYNNENDTEQLLAFYKNASADEIVKGSMKDSRNNVFASYLFKVCIEDENSSQNSLILSSPSNLIKNAENVQNFSIIFGYNNKEGIMWASEYDKEGLKNLERNFSNAIPDHTIFKDEDTKQSFSNDIRQFYFNNGTINSTALVDFFSDYLIFYQSVLNMEAYMNNPEITLFNFYFTYDSWRNLNKLTSSLRYIAGACHADELFYMFDPIFYLLLPPLQKDMEIINAMTTFWTNFAKTGNPSSDTKFTWTRSGEMLKFLEIGEKIKMIDLPHQDRIEFLRQSVVKYQLAV